MLDYGDGGGVWLLEESVGDGVVCDCYCVVYVSFDVGFMIMGASGYYLSFT